MKRIHLLLIIMVLFFSFAFYSINCDNKEPEIKIDREVTIETTTKPTETTTEEETTIEETTIEETTIEPETTTRKYDENHSALCNKYLDKSEEFTPEVVWQCYMDALKDESGNMALYRKINGRIYYKFDDSMTEAEKQICLGIFNEVENIISINFEEYNESINTEARTHLLRIRFNNTEYTGKNYIGMYSYIGGFVNNTVEHSIWVKNDKGTQIEQETFRHELLHFLAINHVESFNSVMTASYGSAFNRVEYTEMDKLTLTLLYTYNIDGETESEIKEKFDKVYY